MPLTLLMLTECTSPAESTRTPPETVSTVVLRSDPVAAMSPETVLALSVPVRSRMLTSPETALTETSPRMPSAMMSPDTVLSFASLRTPETSALADTTPSVRRDLAGDGDADLGLGAARPEVAEHLEEVVPAQLRVVDLDDVAGRLDAEVFDRDGVHFDAHAGLVVGDDVDLAADEADLELADVFDVDDSRLARVDDPLLEGHGSSPVLGLARDISR